MENLTDAVSKLSLSYDDKSKQLICDILADKTIRRVDDYISIFDIIKYVGIANPRSNWMRLYKTGLDYMMYKFGGQGQRMTACVKVSMIDELLRRLHGTKSISLYLGLGDDRLAEGGRGLVREEYVRDHVAECHHGAKEVIIDDLGRIDVLTSKSIIEVKRTKAWMAAIGQLIVYSQYYPTRQKVLYLYGPIALDRQEKITKITQKIGILVIFDTQRWTTKVACADAFDNALDI